MACLLGKHQAKSLSCKLHVTRTYFCTRSAPETADLPHNPTITLTVTIRTIEKHIDAHSRQVSKPCRCLCLSGRARNLVEQFPAGMPGTSRRCCLAAISHSSANAGGAAAAVTLLFGSLHAWSEKLTAPGRQGLALTGKAPSVISCAKQAREEYRESSGLN